MSTISPKAVEQRVKAGRVIIYLKKNRVYDVTEFVADGHPGGADLITDRANTDITDIMADTLSHGHSENAYEMLETYFIGTLDEHGAGPLDSESEKKLYEVTDHSKDFEEHKFLDLDKPLLMQVLRAKWTKKFYLDQVHKPRHYGKGSAQIFGNFLEPLSKTPWWVVPLIHIPVNMLFVNSALQGLSPFIVLPLYVFGLGLWTLVEYFLHRFLFHVDEHMPEHQLMFTIHFILHGIHHYLPMDRLRLVMPPALMVIITSPLYFLAHLVFRDFYVAQSVFAGCYLGYVFYDCTHYFLHHKQLPGMLRATKVHHLDHHYKNYELGFGVTSNFWDVVFGTEFVDTSKL